MKKPTKVEQKVADVFAFMVVIAKDPSFTRLEAFKRELWELVEIARGAKRGKNG